MITHFTQFNGLSPFSLALSCKFNKYYIYSILAFHVKKALVLKIIKTQVKSMTYSSTEPGPSEVVALSS